MAQFNITLDTALLKDLFIQTRKDKDALQVPIRPIALKMKS